MKKSMSKVLCLLLACSTLAASLAGCGTSKTSGDQDKEVSGNQKDVVSGDQNNIESNDSTEPITITVGVPELGNGWPEKAEDDFVHKAILEATNVDIQLIPIDEYYTALNVQLTGGTAPEFFQADYDRMKVYASQGLIKSVTEYKDDVASVFEYLGDEYDNFTLYVDDTMYAFPFGNAGTARYYGTYIRQDFLDKLGMEVPTTVDELYDFCLKAVEENVSGLGQTIGLGGKGWYPYDLIASTYNVHLGSNMIIENGKVTNTLLNPHMQEALTAVKRFCEAGLICLDTFNGGTGSENMRKGLVAIGATQWVPIFKNAYLNTLYEVNPDAEWAFVNTLESNVPEGTGAFGMVDYNNNDCSKFVVNESTSDEKIEAFVKVLNYLSTEEGKMTSWIGIQGEHWDYDENGVAVIKEGMAEKVNYVSTYQLVGRNDAQYLDMKFPEAAEAVAHGNAMKRSMKYDGVLDVPETYYLDDMLSYVDTMLLAFIKGDRPIDEYNNFIQELYDVYDFQTYMDLGQQLVDMGLVTK